MNLQELYDELKEISFDLMGKISYDGISIKWQYDLYNNEIEFETEEEFLNKIFQDDLEIINDYICIDHYDITTPIIDETIISFHIE